MRTYERALQLAAEQGGPVLRGTADMYVGMSELYREHNDLDAATQYLRRSQELGEHVGLPQNPYRWRVAMARIRRRRETWTARSSCSTRRSDCMSGDFFPKCGRSPALRARVWVAQGRLGEALGWARERGLSVDDDLSYLREFEHITLARVLLARHTTEPAERPFARPPGSDRLLEAAEEGGRTGSVIEILVLQALAHQREATIRLRLHPWSAR